ncbi:hypothetical protein HPB48_006130 [Haemaphysalis longicornis]|uniref:Uncharacterized protein n=1 Tax=Haemaphysalis longicornis TaxID=44386 RepID=A0A9J6GHK7_HAELO|nr:hypothetical protein HPB48_006130 [Haemaphysalis longicornis]
MASESARSSQDEAAIKALEMKIQSQQTLIDKLLQCCREQEAAKHTPQQVLLAEERGIQLTEDRIAALEHWIMESIQQVVAAEIQKAITPFAQQVSHNTVIFDNFVSYARKKYITKMTLDSVLCFIDAARKKARNDSRDASRACSLSREDFSDIEYIKDAVETDGTTDVF